MKSASKRSAWTLTPQKYLNPEEVRVLRRFAQNRSQLYRSKNRKQGINDWMILDLALSIGLRVSEIQKLNIGHLFLGYGENHLYVMNGKGGKNRNVIISKELIRHLKDFLKCKKVWGEPLDGKSPLLLSERGRHYTRNGLQRRFKTLCKLAGLPEHHSIHSCRHTFCTELYRKTKNLRLVQKQAGHSSPSITQVYADVLDEEVKRGMDGLFGE